MSTLTDFADEHGTTDEINRSTNNEDTDSVEVNEDPDEDGDFSFIDEDDKPWKTNEFGQPIDNDYHYRIPLRDTEALRLARQALNGCTHEHRNVITWDGFTGDAVDYIGIKTNDSMGYLAGLSEYAHSPKWQTLGPMSEINEYRQNPSGAGTKVKGSFQVDPMSFGGITKLSFETVIDQTPTELEAAYENREGAWTDIQRQLRYVKDDVMEETRAKLDDEDIETMM